MMGVFSTIIILCANVCYKTISNFVINVQIMFDFFRVIELTNLNLIIETEIFNLFTVKCWIWVKHSGTIYVFILWENYVCKFLCFSKFKFKWFVWESFGWFISKIRYAGAVWFIQRKYHLSLKFFYRDLGDDKSKFIIFRWSHWLHSIRKLLSNCKHRSNELQLIE